MGKFLKKIALNSYVAYREEVCNKHEIHWVETEVTRRCPLKCLHCGSSCEMDSPYGEELSAEEIIGVYKRIAEVYDPKKIKVAITGGEPLARKDIYHIMAHISEMGFGISVVTNGMIMNDKVIQYLAASGVTGISVSLDGMQENHDWLRDRKGAWNKAVESIRALQDSGFFYVEPITTVNHRNISDLDALEALMVDIGVPSWRLGKVFPIGRALEYPELFLNGEEFRHLLDFIKARHKNKRRKVKIDFCEIGFLGMDYEMEVRDFFFHCPAGVNILAILADGSVTGCAAVSSDFIQGNIKTDDVVDIWENRFQSFRDRSWMKKGQCGECKVYDYCKGDGFHLWTKDATDPAVCNYKLIHDEK